MRAKKIDPVTRDFLIKVADASSGSEHPALLAAKLDLLKVGGRHEAATEDEIDAFDTALDLAEKNA